MIARELAAAFLVGAFSALAFPLRIPGLGEGPVLEVLPRELFILPAALFLYRLVESGLSLRGQLLRAFVAGVGFFAVVFYWLQIAMVEFGRMPAWQALIVLLLLVIYCALFWGAIPAAHRLLNWHTRLPPVWAFPVAVVLVEWVRTVLFTGFPWGQWGYSQARNLPFAHWSAIGGVYLVTALIALFGALLIRAWDSGERRRWVQAVALIIAVHAGGAVHWGMVALDGSQRTTRVAAIQGNIDQTMKNNDVQYRDVIRKRYFELSEQAAVGGAEVIIWPEAAWPGHLSAEAYRLPVPRLAAPILLGASSRERRGERRAFNSAFWVEPGGRVSARYDKRHLVPFGEYVPLRPIIPVEKFVTGMTDYSEGESHAPIGEPPWGVLICYDGVFPELSRRSAEAGAEVLANVTNDAWYGSSSAADQHRDFYVFRAIETDRWVVRAANTGLSVFIDPTGRLHAQTRLGETTVTTAEVGARTSRTVYVIFGDWLVAVCIGLAIGGALRRGYQAVQDRRAAGSDQEPLTG